MTEKQLQKIDEMIVFEQTLIKERNDALIDESRRLDAIEDVILEVRRLQSRVKELEGVPGG